MRGKRYIIRRDKVAARITPAGAGKTAVVSNHSGKCWDHPRRCGENQCSGFLPHACVGSPPQVRGKLRVTRAACIGRRITPAGAGKTQRQTRPLSVCWDHPRRCGENLPFRGFSPRQLGSPPQVRGKPNSDTRAVITCRITPAGAGKTRQPPLNSRNRWDHPRRCGENFRHHQF